MNVVTSALLGPYGPGALGVDRFDGGLVVPAVAAGIGGFVMAAVARSTAARTRARIGFGTRSSIEAHGMAASRGAPKTAICSLLRSALAPTTLPPWATVFTAAHPRAPGGWVGIVLRPMTAAAPFGFRECAFAT